MSLEASLYNPEDGELLLGPDEDPKASEFVIFPGLEQSENADQIQLRVGYVDKIDEEGNHLQVIKVETAGSLHNTPGKLNYNMSMRFVSRVNQKELRQLAGSKGYISGTEAQALIDGTAEVNPIKQFGIILEIADTNLTQKEREHVFLSRGTGQATSSIQVMNLLPRDGFLAPKDVAYPENGYPPIPYTDVVSYSVAHSSRALAVNPDNYFDPTLHEIKGESTNIVAGILNALRYLEEQEGAYPAHQGGLITLLSTAPNTKRAIAAFNEHEDIQDGRQAFSDFMFYFLDAVGVSIYNHVAIHQPDNPLLEFDPALMRFMTAEIVLEMLTYPTYSHAAGWESQYHFNNILETIYETHRDIAAFDIDQTVGLGSAIRSIQHAFYIREEINKTTQDGIDHAAMIHPLYQMIFDYCEENDKDFLLLGQVPNPNSLDSIPPEESGRRISWTIDNPAIGYSFFRYYLLHLFHFDDRFKNINDNVRTEQAMQEMASEAWEMTRKARQAVADFYNGLATTYDEDKLDQGVHTISDSPRYGNLTGTEINWVLTNTHIDLSAHVDDYDVLTIVPPIKGIKQKPSTLVNEAIIREYNLQLNQVRVNLLNDTEELHEMFSDGTLTSRTVANLLLEGHMDASFVNQIIAASDNSEELAAEVSNYVIDMLADPNTIRNSTFALAALLRAGIITNQEYWSVTSRIEEYDTISQALVDEGALQHTPDEDLDF